MGKEINLLANYPKSKRDTVSRANEKTDADRKIARRFDKEFFDGDRKHGYGGFKYNEKFWTPVIPTFIEYWNLTKDSSVLDVGCGKGFMLYDLKKAISDIEVRGVDIYSYEIENSKEEIKKYLKVADAKDCHLKIILLMWSFLLILFIILIQMNVQCSKEISRVSKKHAFVTVDAFRNGEKKNVSMEFNGQNNFVSA